MTTSTPSCECCEGQLYFYLQSDGCLTIHGKNQHATIIGVSKSPLVTLAIRNKDPLFTHNRTKKNAYPHNTNTKQPQKPLLRNKLIIGPIPSPYNTMEWAEKEVKRWKNEARGLLSRMMWGIHLHQRLGCECYVDEVDMAILQSILSQMSPSHSRNGTTYSVLLRNTSTRIDKA
jgi:hypothetical protein